MEQIFVRKAARRRPSLGSSTPFSTVQGPHGTAACSVAPPREPWRRWTMSLPSAVCLAALVACGGGSELAPLTTEAGEPVSSTAESDLERSKEVLYVLARDGDGFQLGILGTGLSDVKALHYDGVDLLPTMKAMVKAGRAAFLELEDGAFYFVSDENPSSLGLREEGEVSVWTQAGWSPTSTLTLEAVSAEERAATASAKIGVVKNVCPWLTFRTPTTIAANKSCGFRSTTCGVAGKAHTGIDYSGEGSAVAAADGVVVWKQTMSSSDHGMGTNLVVRHRLSTCSYVYSSYSHLASIEKNVKIGSAVSIGQKLGVIGGSGYGKPSYWGRHLHFELKTAPVTGNPLGVGKKKSTCAKDAKNAGPSTCWGYVDSKLGPGAYGYLDPKGYLGK